MVKEFRSHRYHLPSDDLSSRSSWPAAARLAHVNYRIGLAIGDDPARAGVEAGEFLRREVRRRALA